MRTSRQVNLWAFKSVASPERSITPTIALSKTQQHRTEALKMRGNIAVALYNVAEVAADTRLRKQLEDEVMLVSNTHTEDELSAAVGLLMLRYQLDNLPHPSEAKHITPPDQGMTEELKPEATVVYVVRKRSKSHKEAAHTEAKQQTKLSTKMKASSGPSSKSSLLMSCRNILKEFLSQNRL